MSKIIINIPEGNEVPSECLDQIKEMLRGHGIKERMMFYSTSYGATQTKTKPTLGGETVTMMMLEKNDAAELGVRKKLLRLKGVAFEDIPASEWHCFRKHEAHPIFPRKFRCLDKGQGEADLMEFVIGGIVYRRVRCSEKDTTMPEPSSRPDYDVSLLPWTIEINGSVFQRESIQEPGGHHG